MKIVLSETLMLILLSLVCHGETREKLLLRDNWSIQSSEKVKVNGKTLSTVSWKADNWYPATMPSTVLAALLENKLFPDPYYGTDIESLPGYFKDGVKKEMPGTSPFRVSWWYRTVFELPVSWKGKQVWLKFHSINYKANIWLNGHLIADTTSVEGAYRLYNLNIAKYMVSGGKNCLALQIYPPKWTDLSITWVDWNPTPPDRAMGIWYDVAIESTGNVAIEHPHVVTDLDLPSTETAKLTVSAELKNMDSKPVKGILRGKIENIDFSQEVILESNQIRTIAFSPENYKQLIVSDPRLWWPYTAGKPELYDLKLTFETEKGISDVSTTRFGIREITSWMNTFDRKRTRVFQVNGKNIVIRGGGYVQDMMLRPSKERIDIDLAYAKQMNLNTLRMEAPRGEDYIFDRCDEEGILLMVGWCCCSIWEEWKTWTPHMANIAELSWRDQIVHLRNHPSVFLWLYGSDRFPPAVVEKRYIKVLDENDNTRPYLSSATQMASDIAGYTGAFMGPYSKGYAYGSPVYWYKKQEFNTEAGPSGEQIPPLESMRKMMPAKDLWPISNSWNIRLHKAFYPPMREALASRYGKPESVEAYSMKSQVLQLEATRAMFEAYAGQKYKSSGIIYWMYNSAWPSLYWQFYDYYFAPNGSFYGARKACEPLHIQYSYGDSSIYVVNGLYKDFNGLKANMKLYDFSMKERLSKEATFDIGSDGVKKVISFEKPGDLTKMYFLKLDLKDASGGMVSSNFYWLSLNGDEKADFTDLNKLEKVDLKYSVTPLKKTGGKYSMTVNVENPSASLAFSVNPKIINDKTKDLVLPVFWEDNYFVLLPKEKRSLHVEFESKSLGEEDPVLSIEGWNVNPVSSKLK